MIKNLFGHMAIIAIIVTISSTFAPYIGNANSTNAGVSTMSLGDIEPPIVKD